MERRQRLLVAALGAMVLVVVTIGLSKTFRPDTAPQVIYRLIDGKRLGANALADFDVLVSFWSTSCRICLAKMPDLIELHEQFTDKNFTVIAVAAAYDPPSEVLKYVDANPLPFPIALDWDGTTAAAFGGIEGTPVMFLIDRHGKVIQRQSGKMDLDRIRNWLNKRTSA